jgi:flagellar basal-body rod protein FlgG
LSINADGFLTTADGRLLKADIRVPSGSTGLRIDTHGVVTAKVAGESAETELGRIQLASFTNPESLTYIGSGVYEASAGTVDPLRAQPGEEGLGTLESGKLEISNVKLVDEMVTLMLAQRVYELNSRVVQAADEVMALNNSLRKG